MRRGQVWGRWAITIALPVIVGACAATPRDAALPLQDPNEHANRQMLAVNQEMLRPVAEAVQTVVPKPVHDRLRDFNNNLKEPRIFVNNLLQGRLDAAGKTAARFAMNTTFGIGGLVDLATREGVPQQTGDFGQTLFVWGVAEGPYMVRPYWGPTTTRDAVGDVVDRFGDPVGLLFGTQLAVAVTTAGLDTVVRLGQLKQAEDASIDFYSFIRSSYYQVRRAELREAIGQENVIDSPATALDETTKPESGTAAMASAPSATSAPTPRSAAANSAPRSSTKKTARANQEATRVLASTTK
ncbi:MAG TPA: VacJ family lipoprotein [Pseudolabrys sp.]|nr:VacJ family lipoprotein [Pseudolabrys sp.]